VTFGYLLTTFSAVQLIGGPLIGRACDVYGYLFALQLSQFASGLSYLGLGLSSSLPMLFASRVPTLFMHTMHAGQTGLAVMVSKDSRAVSLGRLTMSCTFSPTVHPLDVAAPDNPWRSFA
jgi:OCT family organic cation transporter-like MFS transporter 18